MADSNILNLPPAPAIDHDNDLLAMWDASAGETPGANPVNIPISLLSGAVVNVLDYVVGDASDEYLELQAAINAAENGVLYIPAGVEITINGSIYLGQCHIYGGNRYTSKIICLGDANWTARGTGANKNGAHIMTKAETGAGYGYDYATPCHLVVENLTFEFNKTHIDAPTHGFDVAHTVGLRIIGCDFVVPPGGDLYLAPLDLNEGNKNWEVSNCYFNLDTSGGATGQGGVWIRNSTTLAPNENGEFHNCTIRSRTEDELLAIFVYGEAGDPPQILRNIHVHDVLLLNECTTEVSGGSGGMSIYDKNNANLPHEFDVHVDNIYLRFDNFVNYGIRLEDCPGVSLRDSLVYCAGTTGTTPRPVNVSNLDATKGLPIIENVHVHIEGTPTIDNVEAFFGDAIVRDCRTTVGGYYEMVLTDASVADFEVDELISDGGSKSGRILYQSGTGANQTIRYFLVHTGEADSAQFTATTDTITGGTSGATATAVAPTGDGRGRIEKVHNKNVHGKILGGEYSGCGDKFAVNCWHIEGANVLYDVDLTDDANPIQLLASHTPPQTNRAVYRDLNFQCVGTTNALNSPFTLGSNSSYFLIVEDVTVWGDATTIGSRTASITGTPGPTLTKYDNMIFNDGGTVYREERLLTKPNRDAIILYSGYVGSHTADTDAYGKSITIPAGLIGPRGMIRVSAVFWWSATTSAAPRMRMTLQAGSTGDETGTVFFDYSPTTAKFYTVVQTFANQNDESIQYGSGKTFNYSYGTFGTTGDVTTMAIDTSAESSLWVGANLNAADTALTFHLRSLLVEFIPGTDDL